MKHLFLLLLTFSIFSSCSEDEMPNTIMIRVENSSLLDFNEILINSGSALVEFGNVKASETSEYKKFETAYRYGYVSLVAEGEELEMIPFDYVGEIPLSPGFYTYKLEVRNAELNNKRYLSLELVVD